MHITIASTVAVKVVGERLLRFDNYFTLCVAITNFDGQCSPAQACINRRRYVLMQDQAMPCLEFNQHIKGWRRAPFEYHLLRPTSACFLVGERHRLDATNQV